MESAETRYTDNQIKWLKEYYESLLAERDKGVKTALDAAKEAVFVAEKNAEKWRDNANEWRAAMNDKDRLLVSKAEFNSYKEATEKAIKIEKERSDKIEGKTVGMAALWGYILGAVGLVTLLIGIYNSIKK